METEEQVDTFDFSEAVETFARYLDPEHPDYDPDDQGDEQFMNKYGAGRAVLENALFPEYAAYFFARPFLDAARKSNIHRDFPQLTPEIKLNKNYKTFLSENFPQSQHTETLETYRKGDVKGDERCPMTAHNVRNSKVFPLTFSETEKALFFIQQNDDYLLTMAALRLCIVRYYSELRDATAQKYDVKFNTFGSYGTDSMLAIDNAFSAAVANARSGLTIPHDLTMQLAGALSKAPEPFTKDAVVQGLKVMFERSAFQSINDMGIYKFCPFKNALIDMLRVGLERQEDGSLKATPHQHPGKLILDVRDTIRDQHYQAWADPNCYELKPHRVY